MTSSDVINFVGEAWAAVSEEVVCHSFKRCSLSTALDGSEDGELNERPASANVTSKSAPELRETLQEALSIMFDSGNDVLFDDFEDEDE